MLQVNAGKIPSRAFPEKLPERILFCGWRRDMDDMIQVLESFLPLGSELWLFSEVPVEDREERLKEGGLDPAKLKNVTLVHHKGNPVNRRHLETLPMEDFDSVSGGRAGVFVTEGVERVRSEARRICDSG